MVSINMKIEQITSSQLRIFEKDRNLFYGKYVMTKLPAIGTKAVHKDDYAKSQGPVLEVKEHLNRQIVRDGKLDPPDKVIVLRPAKHKLNPPIDSTLPANITFPNIHICVTPEYFKDNYKEL